MASLNSFPEISNAFDVSGSRFPKGISAGNAQLPGELNPGVPLGMTHGYSVMNPVQTASIITTSGSSATDTFLPLAGISTNNGRFVQDMSVGIQFDYPRAISFACNVACTLIFNITDRYGRKAVNNIPAVNSSGTWIGQTNIGVNILNSVQFITPNSSWTLSVSTTNYIELPFTDMGNQIFFEWNCASVSGVPQPTLVAQGTTAPLKYSYDMAYLPATWQAPGTTTKITTLTGRPRPLMKPQAGGTDINFSSNAYAFICQQAVFPAYNPQLSWLMTPQQAESGETTMGLLPDATGWVGWKG